MIFRISIILIILLVLPAWYIDRNIIKKHRHAKLKRYVLWTPNLFLIVSTLLFISFESYGDTYAKLVGPYLVGILCIGVSEGLFALISLIGCLFRSTKVRFLSNILGLLVALSHSFMILYGYTIGFQKLQVKEHVFASPDLPEAFDGYRIVQFTDLHIGTLRKYKPFIEKLVDSINAQKADAIVFTGDLVNYHASELDGFETILNRLRAPDGVFSIMGNHDYMSYYKWVNKKEQIHNIQLLHEIEHNMGWQLLLNENKIIRRGSDSIAIIGVENDGKPPFPQKGDLKKAMQGIPQYSETKGERSPFFKILLSHDPTHWRRRVLPETDIQLMLAGHTHAMQFKILGYSPSSWFYDEWDGFYKEGMRALFVSIGVGEVLLPIRIGAWPEIDIITLHKKR